MTYEKQLELAGKIAKILGDGEYSGSNAAVILYALMGVLCGDNSHGMQIMADAAVAVSIAGLAKSRSNSQK